MNMDLIEEMTRYIVQRVVKNSKQELEFIERDISRLEMVSQPFPRITYNDAVRILRGEQEVNGKNAIEIQEGDLVAAEKDLNEYHEEIQKHEKEIAGGVKKGVRRFKETRILELRKQLADAEEQMRNIPKWIESARSFEHGNDFGSSDETVLTRVFDAPIMVYNWPVGIKAFYMKEADPEGKFVKGVDLLAPDGYGEIVGGSERESDLDVLLEKLKAHDLSEEVFSWYLDLRKFGSVPHAGFGLGLERMIRWICGLQHLRECIPFPRRMGRLYP
jgi:asparaginyl-tRNA synthetase